MIIMSATIESTSQAALRDTSRALSSDLAAASLDKIFTIGLPDTQTKSRVRARNIQRA
jgi:hypothetical protein